MSGSTPDTPAPPPKAHTHDDEHDKTTRRVQWATEDGGDKPDHSEDRVLETVHLLDEEGLDPTAFQELQRRLQNPVARTTFFKNRDRSGSGAESSTVPTPPDDGPGYYEEQRKNIKTGASLKRRQTYHTYVEPGERDGLPTSSDVARDIEFEKLKEANALVDQHRRGFLSRYYKRGGSRRRKHPPALSVDNEKPANLDIESNAAMQNNIPRLEAKEAGVLSSLLALYNSHSFASGASTPVTASITSDHDTAHSASSHKRSPSGQILDQLSIPVPGQIHRPKTARNSGGVIGSLIATSANISSVATPAGSTLAPDVKRPGYHLNRYSLEKIPDAEKPHNPSRRVGVGKGDSHTASPVTPLIPENTELNQQLNRDPHNRSTSDLADLEPPPKRSSWIDGLSSGNLSLSHLPIGLHAMPFKSKSGTSTPVSTDDEAFFEKKRIRNDRRKKAEIFITKHVAQMLERQAFLLKLARALMMFGAPTHRLEAQIQSCAFVLDIEHVSCLYLPSVMLISFGDPTTATSNIKVIKQGSSLDLGKLHATHNLYWNVIHDMISVAEAAKELDDLMQRQRIYPNWMLILIGGLCSSFICSVGFSGSLIDSLVTFPLGVLLVSIQIFSSRNELYSNVFEIAMATFQSFIAAALSHTNKFCYTAVASSAVVLILPGFIVLTGSLELASRNIISGAVRLCYALIYSLFLGFGLSIGAQLWGAVASDFDLPNRIKDSPVCHTAHLGPWWRQTPSLWWAFLTVPAYSLCLAMRNQAPFFRKEMAATVLISCGGWAANHFAGLRFQNRADVTSACGAFTVGVAANLWGRMSRGGAFVVMIIGIMFQLPSGLANGGLFTFVAEQQTPGGSSTTSYRSGFDVALQLVSVAIGLTVGLFASVVVVYPFGGGRKRGNAGLFSL